MFRFDSKRGTTRSDRNDKDGGGAGIRTLGGITPTTVFETVPFNRSGTPPLECFRPASIFSDRYTNVTLIADRKMQEIKAAIEFKKTDIPLHIQMVEEKNIDPAQQIKHFNTGGSGLPNAPPACMLVNKLQRTEFYPLY